jgi:glycosyltransferase involved in cell wall biosynthesis
MSGTFTILTASHNQKAYQPDWMRSILIQDYRPLQVVFIDDCSGDLASLEPHRKTFDDNDIELIVHRSDERLYCGSSYLKSLDFATGDYMGVLDGDDALSKGAVSRVVRCYERNPSLGFIYTQFNWCDSSLRPKRKGFCRQPLKNSSMLESELSSKVRHCFSHWRTFRSIDAYKSVFKPELKVSVDKHMGYRLEELFPGAFFDSVCYNYRDGVRTGVTRTEASIQTWGKVRKEAFARRKKRNIKPYPVIRIKQS